MKKRILFYFNGSVFFIVLCIVCTSDLFCSTLKMIQVIEGAQCYTYRVVLGDISSFLDKLYRLYPKLYPFKIAWHEKLCISFAT